MTKTKKMREALLNALDKVERLAAGSKWERALALPARYAFAIGYREALYRFRPKPLLCSAPTFFGAQMQVALPAGTDLYLLGGKSHQSEIRLARYMIHTLQPGDAFVDIGAHYGYFALLGCTLTGEQGEVLAFEASRPNFHILAHNLAPYAQAKAVHAAVSDQSAPLTFYEFGALYSEYSTMDISQFEGEPWLDKHPPTAHTIAALPLPEALKGMQRSPRMIKIDVEGAEDKVIAGGRAWLSAHRPAIVMEYLSQERGNTAHRQALSILSGLGYTLHTLSASGRPLPCPDPDAWLVQQGEDSDNLLFLHPQQHQ
ncbi:FkbM family methyltransferase [Phaeodactylibacter luteus]|uniref:FkbM family methyltransferase n=1 Tax=Phaeodactylibacter luteus TaxID=1564516 RepID=A0A5C6RW12_9BACT|nr:FkbM family methyltransferase [Phaeodactylibacter luteus]TXB66297.1 FkbM family methyltransferase [Phaeodactylibacter luteus]